MSDQPADNNDKIKPSGPPPAELTDEEAERLATITPADIARAKIDARRHSPELNALLNAKVVP